MQQISSGIIQYDISPVLPEGSPTPFGYSRKFYRKILEANIPATQAVYFNSRYSKVEETNVDYDYKSAAKFIRDSNSDKYLYCKQFPYLDFCFAITKEIPITDDLSEIRYYEEYKKILGYNCQKATVTKASVVWNLWFSREIQVKDPTNAVIQHPEIEGLILELEEIPVTKNLYFYKRYTVASLEAKSFDDHFFGIPEGYRQVSGIDEARQESRRLLKEEARIELQKNPLTQNDKEMYEGTWLLNTGTDSLLIYVKYSGHTGTWENKYSFFSCHLTKKTVMPENPKPQEAMLAGRKLLVEEPPNFKLYTYNPAKDQIVQADNNLFAYKRLSENEALSIQEEYNINF